MTLVANKYHKFPFFILFIIAVSCSQNNTTYNSVNGFAQGTTYSIIYESENKHNHSHSFDSILSLVDAELSTYDSLSFISKLNNESDSCFSLSNHTLFYNCISKSLEVYELSGNTFNPALYPVVNYWGFYSSNPSSVYQGGW